MTYIHYLIYDLLVCYSCQRLCHLSRSTTKPAHERAAKTIRAGWSESSLCAWRSFGSLVTYRAQNEDWSDCAANLKPWWMHMYVVGFAMLWLKCIRWISRYLVQFQDRGVFQASCCNRWYSRRRSPDRADLLYCVLLSQKMTEYGLTKSMVWSKDQ